MGEWRSRVGRGPGGRGGQGGRGLGGQEKTGVAGAACSFGTTGHTLTATEACHVESECLSRVPSALRPLLRVRES